MSREKELVKNTGILAIGKLSAKLFTFLLLPLYTSVLLPEDYGTIDVLQTVISLSLYIVTLQVDAAIFRYLIEYRNVEKKQIEYLSSGMLVYLAGSVVFTIAIVILNIFWPIPHVILLIAAYWVNSFTNIMLNVLRGYGHNGMYSIVSTAITVVALITNILLILIFHFGGEAILIALFVSNLFGGISVFLYEKLWKKIQFNSVDISNLKEMLSYSIPLVPTAVSWWVANMSDRVLILVFLGSTFNGIYAAANKLPAIYTTIYTIFNLAWTENVTISMKDKDRDGYLNRMMGSSYRFFSFLVLGIICCSSLLFEILIGINYRDAYPHIFILLLAVFFNSMCSMYGGIFIGFKDSKTTGITTILGAVVNLIVNLCLINVIGLYAASVSTLVSYLVILFARMKVSERMVKIRLPLRFTLQLLVMFTIVGVVYFVNNHILMLFVLILVCVWGYFNNKEIVWKIIKTMRAKIMR
ncbi:oligosaccharide flippase family protein [Ruminococcus sp. OA3]|uniref:lipopolysaccharide biosynthesis protein n=1 Tax=Ruminococcus sp. OA3 TaxID=2914164 RepID=UPI001F0684A4|nr:oligosaccharide flippase family protein [Ruminococcus sp. OA3]MCH1982937.1 oligosaccharide flippase family protein [Ruminococcus sp. OA3]